MWCRSATDWTDFLLTQKMFAPQTGPSRAPAPTGGCPCFCSAGYQPALYHTRTSTVSLRWRKEPSVSVGQGYQPRRKRLIRFPASGGMRSCRPTAGRGCLRCRDDPCGHPGRARTATRAVPTEGNTFCACRGESQRDLLCGARSPAARNILGRAAERRPYGENAQ